VKPVAIVPVAGAGTRLRPHTHTTPKSLLLVAGKPILGHILDQIQTVSPERVILVISPGSQGERIRDYAASRTSSDFKIECVIQAEPLGLGHAVAQAKALAGTAPLLIMLGDTILQAKIGDLVKGSSRVGLKEVPDPRRFGVAVVRDGKIVQVVEKPDQPVSNLALVGLYFIANGPLLFDCIDRVIREGRRTRGEVQLTDALELLIQGGEELRAFPVEGWYDCGETETLLETNRALLDQLAKPVYREGVVVLPPVALDPTAEITAAVIGPHVTIGPRAQVRQAVVRNSIVNEGATVRDILLEGSVVGENAVVRGAYQRLNVGDSSEVEYS
jgi:glucose-1-phosphate thymidylyltransferase